jgi:hypothetical protein
MQQRPTDVWVFFAILIWRPIFLLSSAGGLPLRHGDVHDGQRGPGAPDAVLL